jgi:D-aminopeptidase
MAARRRHELAVVTMMRARATKLVLAAGVAAGLVAAAPHAATAQERARARDLGIVIAGTPGPHNAITDVAGVEVGHTTLISGSGRLVVGHGPVRTGVTAILPRGRSGPDSVFAGFFSLNGNGEMTGTAWIDEAGMIETPIVITNTHSAGVARDAVIEWLVREGRDAVFMLPVAAETFDGSLNDDRGFHVRSEHVLAALDGARGGVVPEGSVGGGTGMICHGFKGGIGTASRVVSVAGGSYTLGVLVQCNYGQRRLLRVDGVPVGREIPDLLSCWAGDPVPTRAWLRGLQRVCADAARDASAFDAASALDGIGSIIVVIATDAPLLPHQLERVAKRVTIGVGRMGGLGENSSGDLFLAFSTANRAAAVSGGITNVQMLPNSLINPVFEAAVQATEEAILNAMLAAETMTGVDDLRVYALPHERLREIMRRYGRLQP